MNVIVIMQSAVKAAALHMHNADDFSPQLMRCMSTPRRPTLILSRFKVTHSFRGRSAQSGAMVFGYTISWVGQRFVSSFIYSSQ